MLKFLNEKGIKEILLNLSYLIISLLYLSRPHSVHIL